jgi:hypothetical protein
MVNINPALLQSKGLSAADIVNTVSLQNLIIPAGTAKIGQFEYDVEMNASPRKADELNNIPVKTVGGTTIYLRDVAQVSDGFAPQTNIVRLDGSRGTLVTILKAGNVGPIDFRAGIGEWRYSRSDNRCISDGANDPAVSRELAEHADHCDLDSAFDPELHHRSQRPSRNHQHHDAGRVGAGGRHSG